MREFSYLHDYKCWGCDSEINEHYDGIIVWDGEEESKGELVYHPNDKDKLRPYCCPDCLESCLKEHDYNEDDFSS